MYVDFPYLSKVCQVNCGPVTEIDHSMLEKLETLGSGAFGRVEKAVWKKNGEMVAVKYIRKEMTVNCSYVQEVCALSLMDHKNICKIFGAGTHNYEEFIVMELAMGSLEQIIYGPDCSLIKAQFWTFMHQFAEGLTYIHTRRMVHRDLKPENLLLFPNNQLKIGDLGLARDLSKANGFAGTIRYMAPEVIKDGNATNKSDVYAFGLIINEMLTRQRPYGNYTAKLELMQAVLQGERPALAQDCPDRVRNVAKACWHPEPDRRPTMAQVVAFLKADPEKNIKEDYPQKSKEILGGKPWTVGISLLVFLIVIVIVFLIWPSVKASRMVENPNRIYHHSFVDIPMTKANVQ